jgi:sulfur carrier protein ThiS adenylyltransferase
VEALAEQLAELRPVPRVEALRLWLDEGNIAPLLDKADFWLECLDKAELKATFTSIALRAGKTVIAASGMGGFGGYAMKRRVLQNSGGLLAVVGDFRSDVAQAPPFAPRVMQCAAMQADAALEFILTQNIQPLL